MDLEPIKPDEPLEYLQFPKFLIGSIDISLNAKNIYMLILNRIQIGAKTGNFIDKNGCPFCFFSNEELAELLGLSKPTVTRSITELKEKGLLKREKDSSNKTKNFLFSPVPKSKFDHTKVKNRLDQNQNLITPFPYIRQTIEKDNLTNEISDVPQPPEEPPKPKKNSKAQEATKTIIEHWNKNYQTKYSSESKGTIKLVEAILKSGYQLDQILQVIDYKAKARRTEADYKWFVPATVLALKNFERNYQFMINDQAKPTQNGIRTNYGTQPNQGYKNKNKIPESVTLPEWYEVKESEQANESDVKKILELQNSILKGA